MNQVVHMGRPARYFKWDRCVCVCVCGGGGGGEGYLDPQSQGFLVLNFAPVKMKLAVPPVVGDVNFMTLSPTIYAKLFMQIKIESKTAVYLQNPFLFLSFLFSS